MGLTKKQKEDIKQINCLRAEISSVIDKICEDNKYNITYNQINSALIQILNSNLAFERTIEK